MVLLQQFLDVLYQHYFAVSVSVYLCVRTYHVRNNYVTYIVAMRPCFSRLWQYLDGCLA